MEKIWASDGVCKASVDRLGKSSPVDPETANQKIKPNPQNNQTDEQAAKVADELADEFPLAAHGIAHAAIQHNPGEFAGYIVAEKTPVGITTPSSLYIL